MTISNYAVIESGTVINTVLWDGGAEWSPPGGATAVVIPANTFVNIGYTYNGATFSAPVSG